jgi:hypothetical protein
LAGLILVEPALSILKRFYLESILPNFFLRKTKIFPFFDFKLGHFKFKQYLIMVQTLKLTNKKRKSEEIKVW